MALNSLQSRAIGYIDEIYDRAKSNQCSAMIKSVINFTEFIYSNSQILYSNVNRYFHKIGLVGILMNICMCLASEKSKHILELLHFFIKTNKSIQNEMENKTKFINYLFKTLDIGYLWNKIPTYKYHIHNLEHILMESDSLYNSNLAFINKLFKYKVEDSTHLETIMTYIAFYSCSRKIPDMGCDSQNTNDKIVGQYLSERTYKRIREIVEEYMKAFRIFYNCSENKSTQYIYFEIHCRYTFNQICHLINFYSCLSEKICRKFSETGIFSLLSEILVIKYIPENFILKYLDLLMIPMGYSSISSYLENDVNVYNALNTYLQTNSFSNEINYKIASFTKRYSIPKLKKNVSISEPHSNKKVMLTFNSSLRSSEQFDSLNIDEWLLSNGLSHLSNRLTQFSGKGLKQLKLLLNETDGKIKLIKHLTSQTNLNIADVLELLASLENLQIQ